MRCGVCIRAWITLWRCLSVPRLRAHPIFTTLTRSRTPLFPADIKQHLEQAPFRNCHPRGGASFLFLLPVVLFHVLSPAHLGVRARTCTSVSVIRSRCSKRRRFDNVHRVQEDKVSFSSNGRVNGSSYLMFSTDRAGVLVNVANPLCTVIQALDSLGITRTTGCSQDPEAGSIEQKPRT